MSYSTALLIFLICIILAVVVAAPFIYIARKLRDRRHDEDKAPVGKGLTAVQALPGLLLVAVMFFAFAHQFIAPDGWLGSRVATGEGRFWLLLLALLIFLVLNYWWTIFKRHKRATP